jgi:hypothetical protein
VGDRDLRSGAAASVIVALFLSLVSGAPAAPSLAPAAGTPDDPPFSSNVRINDVTAGSQAEVSLAVDPKGNLYAGWIDERMGAMQCGFSGSSDGGKTWGKTELFQNPQGAFSGDPVVTADRNGNLYRLCLYVSSDFFYAVSKSADGGTTWTQWVTFPAGDKPWLAAQDGKLALSYNKATTEFRTSDDDGKTWSAIKTWPGESGSCVMFDPQGNIHLSWGTNTIKYRKSADGGATFGPEKVLGKGNFKHGSPDSGSLTQCAVDPKGEHVYVVWAGDNAGGGQIDDIWLAHSPDGGDSWDAAVEVNDDTNSARNIMASVALDAKGGVHVAWMDDRSAVAEAWYSNSTDHGKSWSKNLRVNDGSPGKWGNWFGHYTQLVVTPAGRVAYAWADNRGGSNDVWFAAAPVGGGGGGGGLAAITVSPATADVTADDVVAFTAAGHDAAGNPVPISPAWSSTGGSVAQDGRFTPDRTGSFTVSASVGAVSGSAKVAVRAGALAALGVDPPAATITVDEKARFGADGQDAKGNPVAVAPQWSSNGGSIDGTGLFAPDAPGKFTVTASASGVSGSAEVTVTPGQVVRLEVSPVAATLRADAALTFTAVGFDSHGNEGPASVEWSVSGGKGAGSITAAGRYVPEKTGSYEIEARAGSLSAAASVEVLPGKVARASLDPSTASLYVGERVTFLVSAEDAKGNQVDEFTTTFSLSEPLGRVSESGEFLAERAGSGTLKATVADKEVKTSATARITVRAAPFGAPGGAATWPLLGVIVVTSAVLGTALVAWKKRRSRRAVRDYWSYRTC